MSSCKAEVVIIGAGIAGIATAYYLARTHGVTDIAIVDQGQPMAFTSAQSGENYRNWWPHPTMVDWTNRSIDLMEEIALESDNRINMNRRGYALATRRTEIDDLLEELRQGFAPQDIRVHDEGRAETYVAPVSADWRSAPLGVDILRDTATIRRTFPSFAGDIRTIVHIRRGGDISGQQLGMHMLDYLRDTGAAVRVTGTVRNVTRQNGVFRLELDDAGDNRTLTCGRVVNAAGPFADKIAAMLGTDLPVHHTFQQKIAFEDTARAVPRDLPFSIDLDPQHIDWTDEERALLAADPSFVWVTEEMPGAIHCRPDGGDMGTWIKLGWAFNDTPQPATWEPPLNDQYPEIVLRGAARLQPGLKHYYGQLPRSMHHYGGWYTMTEENWPLIGPLGEDGAFVVGALSGFGTMAACAAGELGAAWVAGGDLPAYATDLSLARRDDTALMTRLRQINKGVL